MIRQRYLIKYIQTPLLSFCLSLKKKTTIFCNTTVKKSSSPAAQTPLPSGAECTAPRPGREAGSAS